jgi:hypothetical protein
MTLALALTGMTLALILVLTGMTLALTLVLTGMTLALAGMTLALTGITVALTGMALALTLVLTGMMFSLRSSETKTLAFLDTFKFAITLGVFNPNLIPNLLDGFKVDVVDGVTGSDPGVTEVVLDDGTDNVLLVVDGTDNDLLLVVGCTGVEFDEYEESDFTFISLD